MSTPAARPPSDRRRHVTLSSTNGCHQLLLDDVDVSPGLRGATLVFEPGCLPKLTLDPMVVSGSAVVDQAEVIVRPAAAELLVSLGWTPPAADPGDSPS